MKRSLLLILRNQERDNILHFSRLAASESAEIDPVAYVQNPLLFLQQELERLTSKYG